MFLFFENVTSCLLEPKSSKLRMFSLGGNISAAHKLQISDLSGVLAVLLGRCGLEEREISAGLFPISLVL